MTRIQLGISQDGAIAIAVMSVFNITTDRLYTCTTENCPLPVQLNNGDEIKVNYLCENVGGEDLYIRHYIALIDPLSVIRAESQSPAIGECPALLEPGWQFGNFNEVQAVLDVEGIWVIHAVVDYDTSATI